MQMKLIHQHQLSRLWHVVCLWTQAHLGGGDQSLELTNRQSPLVCYIFGLIKCSTKDQLTVHGFKLTVQLRREHEWLIECIVLFRIRTETATQAKYDPLVNSLCKLWLIIAIFSTTYYVLSKMLLLFVMVDYMPYLSNSRRIPMFVSAPSVASSRAPSRASTNGHAANEMYPAAGNALR